MSKENKKIEKTEQETTAGELSELDLDNVAGGGGASAPLTKKLPVEPPIQAAAGLSPVAKKP
jgi:hypothetical protein